MKRILFVFLLSICAGAFGLFSNCDVVYVGTESEVSELKQLIESVVKNISACSTSGKKLIDILDRYYLTEYAKQNTISQGSPPKILIQFGSKTSFSPTDLTGSPGRLLFSRENVLEQQNLMNKLDDISFELTSLLKANEAIINEAYELCSDKTKAVLKLKYKAVVQNIKMFDSRTQEKLTKLIYATEALESKKKDICTELELLKSSSSKSSKSKDLNITIKKSDSKLYTPGCVLVEGNNVLIAPNETPFEVIFAHELIHMKHYLEEQIFRVDSLKVVADLVFQMRDKFPDIGTLSTKEDTLSKLLESSTVRSNIFFRFPTIDGNDKLVWNVRDLKNLPLLAYSIAGELSESSIKTKGISLPEIIYREPGVLSELVGDLEERRTVLGSDRDGITENIIRMEMNLPLRYIYQGSLQAMFEKKETVATILGENSIDYILKNSSKWTKDKDVEFLKQDAMKNKLSIYEKQTLSDD